MAFGCAQLEQKFSEFAADWSCTWRTLRNNAQVLGKQTESVDMEYGMASGYIKSSMDDRNLQQNLIITEMGCTDVEIIYITTFGFGYQITIAKTLLYSTNTSRFAKVLHM